MSARPQRNFRRAVPAPKPSRRGEPSWSRMTGPCPPYPLPPSSRQAVASARTVISSRRNFCMATTRSPATSNASPGPSLPARFAVDWPRQEMPPRHEFLPEKSKKGAADRGKTYGRKTEGAAADPVNSSSCPHDPAVQRYAPPRITPTKKPFPK